MNRNLSLSEFINVINKYLHYIVLITASYYIIIFIVSAILRMNYPFDLEWFEGTVVENLLRLKERLPLYSQPSLRFIPLIYPPGYLYLSQLFAEVTGYGYLPLRLVSIISTLSIILIIFLFVNKETGSKQLALLSAGLFAACFEISGFWYDLARVDMLFMAFSAWSLYLLKFRQNFMGLFIAGILAYMSLLTKQTALVFIFPFIIYLIFRVRWKSFYYLIPLISLSWITLYYLNCETGGWFNFWLFELPAKHDLVYTKIISFWTSDILNPLAFAFFVSLSYLIIKFFDKKKNDFFFYILAFIGFFTCAWISRIHLGGYDNVLIPAFFVMSIMFGLGINEFQRILSGRTIGEQSYLKLFILIAIVSQFCVLLNNPLRQIPGIKDVEYGNQLVEEIRKYKGDVYLPEHPYYARLAGKNYYTHYYLLLDFMESGTPESEKIKEEYTKKIEETYFSAIILDSYPAHNAIDNYYELDKTLFAKDNYFKCKTGGHKTRPEFILIGK
jgi:hypothetical protein